LAGLIEAIREANVGVGEAQPWPGSRADTAIYAGLGGAPLAPLVSPQHGQATYSLYSRIGLSPRTQAYPPPIVCKIPPIGGEQATVSQLEQTEFKPCLGSRAGPRGNDGNPAVSCQKMYLSRWRGIVPDR
jgi:hypothetical protein